MTYKTILLIIPSIRSNVLSENINGGFLKEHVAAYKMPRVIEFMNELPTSGVGKILKRELKKIMAG